MRIDDAIEEENAAFWHTRTLAAGGTGSQDQRNTCAILALAHATRWAALVDLRSSGIEDVTGVRKGGEE